MGKKDVDSFTPHTQIKCKWITEPNVQIKTIKALEDNTGINVCDSGLDTDFFTTPKRM